VRPLALAALARLGDAPALARCRTLWAQRSERRRAEALLAAGIARLDAVRPELERWIERPEAPAFIAALEAAASLGDVALVPVLDRVARSTADRAVFESVVGAAAELADLLGDDAPPELRRLADAVFETAAEEP
jgi:hypothetical protein